MRFSLEVGDGEKCRVEFYRGPLFGAMTVTANGKLVAFKDPEKLSTHFSFEYVNRYEFSVGEHEPHEVAIEHERPWFLGGLRRNQYRVYVDGKLVEGHYGF
jgi:hypothetical protein